MSRFERRPSKPTVNPRRVVGGTRLQTRVLGAGTPGSEAAEAVAQPGQTIPSGWTWASSRWMRLAEDTAPGDQLAEGLDYARAGQTRSLEIKPGIVTARVQGRMPAAYRTTIRLPLFTHEQWEKVIAGMGQQAKYAAALLAGELPTNVEDLFAPAGLRLFPTDPSDLATSCTCDIFTGRPSLPAILGPGGAAEPVAPPAGPTPWCKHVCCTMYLIAERLGQQPLLIFSLRGLAEADLTEHLRQQRALAGMQRAGGTGGGGGGIPVYTPHVPGLPRGSPPLDDALDRFWGHPEEEAAMMPDMPIAPPEVTHPLLRRLGPSPFAGAKFPLVGLLATCYDVISRDAIQGSDAAPISGADET